MLRILILVMFFLVSNYGNAQQEIDKLNESIKLKTDVMVLGSLHLSGTENNITDNTLTPIIELLESYKPTAIAVESLRAEDIIAMLNGSKEYQQILDIYVGDTLLSLAKNEQLALGISATDAIKKMNVMLSNVELSLKQRAELVQLAIAGYNPDIAVLHWQYLDKKSINSGISAKLQTYLNLRLSSTNERISIATTLASKLKLNRLYAIDDHLDKDMYQEMVNKLMPAYEKSAYAKQLPESDYINKPIRLRDEAISTGNWLPVFLWLNSKEYNSEVIDKDWAQFANKDIDPKVGLARLALWEIRNLNMASNIMRVVAEHTGEKVLIVVGSVHKVFLEAYLSNMVGVNLVQFSDLVPSEN